MKTVTDVQALPHLRGSRIDLTWTLPPSSDFEAGRRLGGIKVVRRERTFPRDDDDGVVVYDDAPVNGIADAGLSPQHTYYYTVFAVEENEPGVPPPINRVYWSGRSAQVAALATTDYGSTTQLYSLLPGIHRVHDPDLTDLDLQRIADVDPKLAAALATLPADIRRKGQLRRFVRAAGSPLDLMRSMAEALRQLHDVDEAPSVFLPMLAHWVGWDVDETLPVYEQRNEVKFAPHLYRTVGTVDSLRRLVTRYTGWYTRAAEMDQALVRSNQPAQLNVYASAESGMSLVGTDDASTALGFGIGNRTAAGTDAPAKPATLTGTVGQPFVLRQGMELTVTVDDRLPTTVRFQPGDFADIGAATAAEVAAAIGATLTQLSATAVAGRVVLTSHLAGAISSLEIAAASSSLVSLDGAPRGRLAAFADGTRLRLVFAAADPLDVERTDAARATLAGEPPVLGVPPGRTGDPDPLAGRDPLVVDPAATDRIYVKTWTAGQWRSARPLFELPPAAQGWPAAATFGGGVFCAWVELPDTTQSKLRCATASPLPARPASLAGTRSEPFVVEPGTHLVFGGRWPVQEGVELAASELPPMPLTAAQVRTLLIAHLTHVDVTVTPRNTLVFSTKTAGGDERLQLDLAASSAAAALGFGPDNASAVGSWDDELAWGAASDVASLPAGRYADAFAVADPAAANAVDLLWAVFDGTLWRIQCARRTGAVWGAVQQVAWNGSANRDPCAVRDAGGALQAFYSQQAADGRWLLRRRRRAGTVWSGDAPVFAAAQQPAMNTDGDREPCAQLLPNGKIRVLFRSDRSGGLQIWSTVYDPATGTATAPVQLSSGAAHRTNPALIQGPAPDGRTWILHRSDANVPLARVGVHQPPHPLNRVTTAETAVTFTVGAEHSGSAEDLGTRRRYAGSTTPRAWDVARFGRRREFDDLIAYTPQRTVTDPALMAPDDLYTRGTVGLYLSPTAAGDPLSQQKERRLRPALQRFVPINVRPVLILAPRGDVEVFTPYDVALLDKVPLVDYWPPTGETVGVKLPGWTLFMSDVPGAAPLHLAADPANPATLRDRTWRPNAE